MQVKTILNQCHKFKSFVYDQVRFVVEKGERFIEVTVVPRRNGQAICSCCGERAPLYDRLEGRRFEFIPLWGYRVFLRYVMRREGYKVRLEFYSSNGAIRSSGPEIGSRLARLPRYERRRFMRASPVPGVAVAR